MERTFHLGDLKKMGKHHTVIIRKASYSKYLITYEVFSINVSLDVDMEII